VKRPHDKTWIIGTVSTVPNSEVAYAAIPLSKSFRETVRKLVRAWRAAVKAYGKGGVGLTVQEWYGPAHWMHSLPEGAENLQELETEGWVEFTIPPLEELALGREACIERQSQAIDAVTVQTDMELTKVQDDKTISFTAQERHDNHEMWSNDLPLWVIEWILDGKENEE
jgi:hypothetical protein